MERHSWLILSGNSSQCWHCSECPCRRVRTPGLHCQGLCWAWNNKVEQNVYWPSSCVLRCSLCGLFSKRDRKKNLENSLASLQIGAKQLRAQQGWAFPFHYWKPCLLTGQSHKPPSIHHTFRGVFLNKARGSQKLEKHGQVTWEAWYSALSLKFDMAQCHYREGCVSSRLLNVSQNLPLLIHAMLLWGGCVHTSITKIGAICCTMLSWLWQLWCHQRMGHFNLLWPEGFSAEDAIGHMLMSM